MAELGDYRPALQEWFKNNPAQDPTKKPLPWTIEPPPSGFGSAGFTQGQPTSSGWVKLPGGGYAWRGIGGSMRLGNPPPEAREELRNQYSLAGMSQLTPGWAQQSFRPVYTEPHAWSNAGPLVSMLEGVYLPQEDWLARMARWGTAKGLGALNPEKLREPDYYEKLMTEHPSMYEPRNIDIGPFVSPTPETKEDVARKLGFNIKPATATPQGATPPPDIDDPNYIPAHGEIKLWQGRQYVWNEPAWDWDLVDTGETATTTAPATPITITPPPATTTGTIAGQSLGTVPSGSGRFTSDRYANPQKGQFAVSDQSMEDIWNTGVTPPPPSTATSTQTGDSSSIQNPGDDPKNRYQRFLGPNGEMLSFDTLGNKVYNPFTGEQVANQPVKKAPAKTEKSVQHFEDSRGLLFEKITYSDGTSDFRPVGHGDTATYPLNPPGTFNKNKEIEATRRLKILSDAVVEADKIADNARQAGTEARLQKKMDDDAKLARKEFDLSLIKYTDTQNKIQYDQARQDWLDKQTMEQNRQNRLASEKASFQDYLTKSAQIGQSAFANATNAQQVKNQAEQNALALAMQARRQQLEESLAPFRALGGTPPVRMRAYRQ